MPPGGVIIAAALIGMAVWGGAKAVKATNKHVVKPAYHHVVQPVGHGIKKVFVHKKKDEQQESK